MLKDCELSASDVRATAISLSPDPFQGKHQTFSIRQRSPWMPNFTPICASQDPCPHAPAELQISSQAPNTEWPLTGADKGPRKTSCVKDCLPLAPIST